MEPKLPTAHASLALIAFTPKRLSLTTTARAPVGRASTTATIEASAATCRVRPPAWRSLSNRRVTHHGSGRGVNSNAVAGALDGRESAYPYGGEAAGAMR